jgi:hypothetical protein
MSKTPEEIAADEEAASKAHREQLAKEANKKRNDAMLEARNAIADSADEIKVEEDGLEPLTDEVWDQEDHERGTPRKTRAQRIADQDAEEEAQGPELGDDGQPLSEDEAAARLIRKKEAEDRENDDAREAGASDVRKKGGVTQYLVGGKWLTLAQVRELGGDTSEPEELQEGEEGDTNSPDRRTSPTAAELQERQRQADERAQAERAERKQKLRDLYTRASMGDEEAIDQLADMQADQSRVTPDLQRMVNEQVDARIAGRSDFQKAVDWFESDEGFADVLTTPRLKAEAARLDVELARQNPALSPRARLEKVGKQMRQLREDLGGAPAQGGRRTTTPRPPTKLERKRNAPQAPQEAAGRQRPDVEPDEAESTQEAIARMAQSRGQARAIKH